MRKVVLALGTSLDGYIARENGSVDWLSVDWDYDWESFMETIDTVVMGRRSWEKYVQMMGGAESNPYKGKQTYVLSSKLTESVAEGVEIVDQDVGDFIEGLKGKDGKKIWLSGGGELVASFLELDLVDEINLGVTPILLGSGIRLFPDVSREIPLRFVSSKPCYNKQKDNAMVELVYEVVRS